MAHRCKRFRIARLLSIRRQRFDAYHRALRERRSDDVDRLLDDSLNICLDVGAWAYSRKGRRIRRRFEREAAIRTEEVA